jgi:hypothetical protein
MHDASGCNWGRSVKWLCGLVLGAAATSVEVASADPVPAARPVQVERNGCEALPPEEIVSILRVELLGRLLEGPPRADADPVTIDCSGDVVEISVGAPDGTSKSTRTTLTGAPTNIRSRIVALAIAELVRDLDRELLRGPPPAHPPAPSGDPLTPPERASNPSRPIDLSVFAQTSGFPLHDLWLAGGGLRFDFACRLLCVGFDASLLTTTERFAQGTAQVFLGYASPYLAWRYGWGRAETLLGAGYALGAARLVGRAADAGVIAGTTTGAWTAPYGLAVLALALTGDLSVEARGQLGWVIWPVIGEVSGGTDVAIRGLWASVQAGLAITL